MKLLSALLMLLYVVLKLRFDSNLVFLSLILVPVFTIHFFLAFNYKAAAEELFRYILPIIVLFFSYAIKDRFNLLMKFLVALLIINYIAQIINYVLWFNGINQWFYVYTETGRVNIPMVAGVLRATGIMGFFSTFGFLNLIMYFLISFFYKGKYKRTLVLLSIIFLFLSISFKGIATFLFLLILFSRHRVRIFLGAMLLFIGTLFVFPNQIAFLAENAKVRIEAYVLEGDSARSESYRAMLNETHVFIGEGIGSFGGPSSTQYKSPFYEKIEFDWHGLPNLPTTDTYYPHLFVELGLLGGLLYLFIFFVPLLRLKATSKLNFKAITVIYLALFIDALVTFSLNNLVYLSLSMLVVYPLIYLPNEKS